MIKWLRQKFCKHTFRMLDLKKINEDGPERVAWPCRKCGKVFKAHCGLDIIPKHGYLA